MLWERVTADRQAREIRQTRPATSADVIQSNPSSSHPRERRGCGGFVQELFGHALCVLQSGPISTHHARMIALRYPPGAAAL